MTAETQINALVNKYMQPVHTQDGHFKAIQEANADIFKAELIALVSGREVAAVMLAYRTLCNKLNATMDEIEREGL